MTKSDTSTDFRLDITDYLQLFT